MRRALAGTGILAALGAASAASACAPPPPGYVLPTHEERLRSAISHSSDIVYGVIRKAAARDKPAQFEVLHVYRGTASRNQILSATSGFDLPEPVCAGMGGPPGDKPVGTYGVVAYRWGRPQLSFIKLEDVHMLVREGVIRSAQAR